MLLQGATLVVKSRQKQCLQISVPLQVRQLSPGVLGPVGRVLVDDCSDYYERAVRRTTVEYRRRDPMEEGRLMVGVLHGEGLKVLTAAATMSGRYGVQRLSIVAGAPWKKGAIWCMCECSRRGFRV